MSLLIAIIRTSQVEVVEYSVNFAYIQITSGLGFIGKDQMKM